MKLNNVIEKLEEMKKERGNPDVHKVSINLIEKNGEDLMFVVVDMECEPAEHQPCEKCGKPL